MVCLGNLVLYEGRRLIGQFLVSAKRERGQIRIVTRPRLRFLKLRFFSHASGDSI